ncbi:MAG: YggT family protein [Alphaproteobacteria bacterium]|nr:YggT family protein [Alphaproteobacteria bacterium]
MGALIFLINLAFDIYMIIIILQVAISWLIVFDVINTNNEQAQNLIKLLKKATDPVYKPLRKYIPPIGGIDITPIIVLLGLSVVRFYLVKFIVSLGMY